MSQNSNATNESDKDFEAASLHLATLRADISHLAETFSGIAANRRSQLSSDIVEGIGEAKHYVE